MFFLTMFAKAKKGDSPCVVNDGVMHLAGAQCSF